MTAQGSISRALPAARATFTWRSGSSTDFEKKPLKKTAAPRKLNLTYVFLFVEGRETAFQDSPRSC